MEVREVGWGVVEGQGRTFLLYVGEGEGSIEYIVFGINPLTILKMLLIALADFNSSNRILE